MDCAEHRKLRLIGIVHRDFSLDNLFTRPRDDPMTDNGNGRVKGWAGDYDHAKIKNDPAERDLEQKIGGEISVRSTYP